MSKIFLLFICLLCLTSYNENDLKYNSKVTYSNKELLLQKNTQPNLFLVLKENVKQSISIDLLNLDKKPFKKIKFNENFKAFKGFNPFYLESENLDLVFTCLEKKEGYYEIIFDEKNGIKKLISVQDTNFKLETIQEHLVNSTFSVEFDPKTNPLHISSSDKSNTSKYDNNQFYYPVKIKGNWLMINDDNNKNYWIKWRDNNGKILIKWNYDA